MTSRSKQEYMIDCLSMKLLIWLRNVYRNKATDNQLTTNYWAELNMTKSFEKKEDSLKLRKVDLTNILALGLNPRICIIKWYSTK